MTVLVTGVAGFIGNETASTLIQRGETVIGVDNLNDYYDVALKEARLARLMPHRNFSFHRIDVTDKEAINSLFSSRPDITHVIHLAAQAGVRFSLINPLAYISTNVFGHTVMIEGARMLKNLAHFVYASSSSVYGSNQNDRFSVEDRVDVPNSLYAATKRADELISHTYAQLYGIPQTGLRFFTVYGPWGRPDMAAYIFVRKILAGEEIEVFNNGEMMRDFTYIGDIVRGIVAAVDRPPSDKPPHRIYNLGNSRSEKLGDFIREIESALGRTAKKKMMPMQLGDVRATLADIDATRRDLGFEPRTSIREGIPRFVEWYRSYHQQ